MKKISKIIEEAIEKEACELTDSGDMHNIFNTIFELKKTVYELKKENERLNSMLDNGEDWR